MTVERRVNKRYIGKRYAARVSFLQFIIAIQKSPVPAGISAACGLAFIQSYAVVLPLHVIALQVLASGAAISGLSRSGWWTRAAGWVSIALALGLENVGRTLMFFG